MSIQVLTVVWCVHDSLPLPVTLLAPQRVQEQADDQQRVSAARSARRRHLGDRADLGVLREQEPRSGIFLGKHIKPTFFPVFEMRTHVVIHFPAYRGIIIMQSLFPSLCVYMRVFHRVVVLDIEMILSISTMILFCRPGGRLPDLLVRAGSRRRRVGHLRVWRNQGRQEFRGRRRRVRDHDRRRRVHCAEQVVSADIIRNPRNAICENIYCADKAWVPICVVPLGCSVL